MSRTVAVIWHVSFCAIAGVLYFFFVLPRWPELMGDTSHTLGTVLRIVVGALVGLAALPVVFTLLRTRRPEFGTPQLALSLRTASIVLHVLAAVLIIGAAISEMWLTLDAAGRWLFGIYGAAAALALLGILSFYLASVAELPPPPPKPLKVKEPKQRRRGRKGADEEAQDDAATSGEAEESGDAEAVEPSSGADDENAEVTVADDSGAEAAEAAEEPEASTADEPAEGDAAGGKLRNRRPSGNAEPGRRRRRRLRGGVAVDD